MKVTGIMTLAHVSEFQESGVEFENRFAMRFSG